MKSDTLTVFVPTRLVNPLNAREHWATRAKRAKEHRELVALAVWSALRNPERGARMVIWRITAKPETPKRITLLGHVARKFDSDGLQAAMKSVRDGLQDCGLIHHDGPDSGHVFTYGQEIKRPHGVTITVEIGRPGP